MVVPKENEPLQNSIQKRLDNERLELPDEKPKKKKFNIQNVIIFAILISLLLTIIQIYLKFF